MGSEQLQESISSMWMNHYIAHSNSNSEFNSRKGTMCVNENWILHPCLWKSHKILNGCVNLAPSFLMVTGCFVCFVYLSSYFILFLQSWFVAIRRTSQSHRHWESWTEDPSQRTATLGSVLLVGFTFNLFFFKTHSRLSLDLHKYFWNWWYFHLFRFL